MNRADREPENLRRLAEDLMVAATDIAAVPRAGYRAAFLFSGDGRVNRGPVTDMYRLPRIAMGPDTDLKAVLEQP